VKPDNAIEKGVGDGGSRVGVAERNKMCVLGEAINDDENDRLATEMLLQQLGVGCGDCVDVDIVDVGEG